MVVETNGHVNSGNIISFANISYTVEESKWFGKKVTKEILNDVNGVMRHGLNAIMGPTGSGKTSLLDVLAKRKDKRWLSGRVLLNGKKLPGNYKYLSGYVVQNDNLIATLTVRECLWFSANLRLPTSISHAQKERRIAELLEQLGLQKCADSKIGNSLIRGVSGGERKRTAIGAELITKPSVLFLDEPTTGLDAFTANSVMRLLKKLSEQGQTIIISIHQPRYSIFRLFDSLTLLSLGKIVYHGDAKETLPYFASIGYECEAHNNPADFFLDVINGEVHTQSEDEFHDHGTKYELDVKMTDMLQKTYRQSDFYQTMTTHQQAIESQPHKQQQGTISNNAYATSFSPQLKYLLIRDFRNVFRDPQGFLTNIIVNIIMGVFFGLLYLQLDGSPDAGTQNRLGLLLYVTSNVLFSANDVIMLFVAQKSIFICEYVSGYYSVIAYFISKLVAYLIPMRSMEPLIYGVVTYWMVGLRPEVDAFFIFVLVLALNGYAAVAIGTFLSTTFDNYSVANQCFIVISLIAMAFSGLLANVNSIVEWLRWLQYISIARYGFVAIAINEFAGQVYTNCSQSTNQTCKTLTGNQILHDTVSVGSSPDHITSWDLWQNVMALAIVTVGMFFLTYVQLVRCKKYT